MKNFIKKNKKLLIVLIIVLVIISIPLSFKLAQYLRKRSSEKATYKVFDVVREAYSDIEFKRSNLIEGKDYTIEGDIYTFKASSLNIKNLKNNDIKINADLKQGIVYVDYDNAIRFTNKKYYCYGSSKNKHLTCEKEN